MARTTRPPARPPAPHDALEAPPPRASRPPKSIDLVSDLTPADGPGERHLYRLRVVDRVDGERTIQAPFHYHTAGHATFSRFTSRPSPSGEKDDAGRIVRERIQGALAWLDDSQVEYIKDRIRHRFVEWQPGSADVSGKSPLDPYFKGIIRIVPPGRHPMPGWEPVGHFLRMDLIENPAEVSGTTVQG